MIGLELDYANARCPKCKANDYLRWAHKVGNKPLDYDLYCVNCGGRFKLNDVIKKKETATVTIPEYPPHAQIGYDCIICKKFIPINNHIRDRQIICEDCAQKIGKMIGVISDG